MRCDESARHKSASHDLPHGDFVAGWARASLSALHFGPLFLVLRVARSLGQRHFGTLGFYAATFAGGSRFECMCRQPSLFIRFQERHIESPRQSKEGGTPPPACGDLLNRARRREEDFEIEPAGVFAGL